MNKTGFDPAPSMDSVFDQSTNSEIDFDVMYDREDQFVDIVAGYNEAGDPLTGVDFETLHQDSYEDKVSDFKDELETNGDAQGAKGYEGSTKQQPDTTSVGTKRESESDSEKFIGTSDKDYQAGKNWNNSSVGDTVNGTINKAGIDGVSEGWDIDSILEDTDEDVPNGKVGDTSVNNSSSSSNNNDQKDDQNDKSVKEDSDLSVDGETDSATVDDIETEMALIEMELETSFDEEGELIDPDKNPNIDTEAREGKKCSCGKADCPVCGKIKQDVYGYGGNNADNPVQPDKNGSGVGYTDPIQKEYPVDGETDSATVDDIETEMALIEMELMTEVDDSATPEKTEEKEPDNDKDSSSSSSSSSSDNNSSDSSKTDGEQGVSEGGDCENCDSSDSSDDVEAEMAMIEMELMFNEADKEVRDVASEDDPDDEKDIKNVDKLSKKAGKLDYSLEDEELIDQVMDEDFLDLI